MLLHPQLTIILHSSRHIFIIILLSLFSAFLGPAQQPHIPNIIHLVSCFSYTDCHSDKLVNFRVFMHHVPYHLPSHFYCFIGIIMYLIFIAFAFLQGCAWSHVHPIFSALHSWCSGTAISASFILIYLHSFCRVCGNPFPSSHHHCLFLD